MTADFRMALLELLRQYQGEPEADALREGLRWLAQQLMEVEVSERIGAQRYERTPSRTTYRNGYCPRRWDTRVGTIELAIPKLRRGSYFPSLLGFDVGAAETYGFWRHVERSVSPSFRGIGSGGGARLRSRSPQVHAALT